MLVTADCNFASTMIESLPDSLKKAYATVWFVWSWCIMSQRLKVPVWPKLRTDHPRKSFAADHKPSVGVAVELGLVILCFVSGGCGAQ